MSVSRRAVLAGGALAGTAVAVGGGVLWTQQNEDAPAQTEPFYGEHQAGIATPAQARAELVALDLRTKSPAEIEAVFRAWTDLVTSSFSQTPDADLLAASERYAYTPPDQALERRREALRKQIVEQRRQGHVQRHAHDRRRRT